MDTQFLHNILVHCGFREHSKCCRYVAYNLVANVKCAVCISAFVCNSVTKICTGTKIDANVLQGMSRPNRRSNCEFNSSKNNAIVRQKPEESDTYLV